MRTESPHPPNGGARPTHPDRAPVLHLPGVFERLEPVGAPVPVVFDAPHSGSRYPGDFGYAVSWDRIRSTEDMFVDELFGSAPEHGATLLRALFPRAYIDVNRGPLDIDESLLAGPWPEPVRPGDKTRNGKGLIRSLAGEAAIYDRKLEVAEVRARLERFYRPYHAALAEAVEQRRQAFGSVWHVNCHSWTPPERGRDGIPLRHVDFFIGDRDGTTAEPAFTEAVAGYLGGLGYVVRVNRVFKGMELVRRHGQPGAGRHSLQIEINRHLYMNHRRYERLESFAALQSQLDGLIRHICDFARAAL